MHRTLRERDKSYFETASVPAWFIVHRFEPPIRIITASGFVRREQFQDKILNDFLDPLLELSAITIDGYFFVPESFEGPEGMCTLWRNTGHKERVMLENFVGRDELVIESLLNNLNAEIVVFSTDHRYVYANQKAFKDNEFRKWIIGRNDYDLFQRIGKNLHLADERRMQFNRCLNANQAVEWTERFEWNGEFRFRNRQLIPLLNQDGTIAWILGFGYDVTETRRLNEHLERNRDELKHLLESNMAGIFRSTVSGKFLELNDAFAATFGYTRDELLNAPAVSIYFNQADRNDYIQRLTNEKVLKNYEMHLKRKNGSEVFILANITLDDSKKDEPELIGTLIDITELKQTSKELDSTVNELRQKSEDILKFSHIVSHHLRAPVVNAKNILQLLIRKSNGDAGVQELATKVNGEIALLDDSLHELHNVLEGRSPDHAFFSSIGLPEFVRQVTDEFRREQRIDRLRFNVSGNDTIVMRTQTSILKNCLWTLFNFASNRLDENNPEATIDIAIEADAKKCSIIVTPTDRNGVLINAHASIVNSPGIQPMINYLGGQIEVAKTENQQSACILSLPLAM